MKKEGNADRMEQVRADVPILERLEGESKHREDVKREGKQKKE